MKTPGLFASENDGYVTIRRGTELFSSGSAAAPGVVKRVRTAHFNTKIMPHIGPTVFGGEMIEGHHSCKRKRRSPQESEWESNSEHVDDMTEVCGRKLASLRTPTPVTKATGKGRRDIDDELEQHDVRASREVAGTGASSTGPSSIQFAMIVVCPEETWLHWHQADPKMLYVYQDTDWSAEELTRKAVLCTAGKHDSQAMQRREAIAERTGLQRSESHGIVKRLPGVASSWRVRVAPPWFRQWWERVAPPELMGGSSRAVMTSKQTSQILEQIGTGAEVRTTSDSSAARETCMRNQICEKAVPVDQRTVDPGTTPQERIPAGVGGYDHEYG